MGKFSILLCDSDEIYAKRLAAGLQKMFRERVAIHMVTDAGKPMDLKDVQLVLASDMKFQESHTAGSNVVYIYLDGGEGSAENVDWNGRIFKYQSVAKIGKALTKYMPDQPFGTTLSSGHEHQRWYGVVSPVRHGSMLPFAVSLAQQLSVGKRVLLLVFMEFSGITALLGLEEQADMEQFILELRNARKEDFYSVSLPEIHQIPAVDLMKMTENPMVLYEIREQDMCNVIQRIQISNQYDVVVWVAGNMMRGIVELMRVSARIFCVEDTDSYSRGCQQEFHSFFEKTGVDEKRMQYLTLPSMQGMESGEHLLMQWADSSIADIVKQQLKGAAQNGVFNAGIA